MAEWATGKKQSKAKPPQGAGTQKQAHKSAQTTLVCAVCRPAPARKGGVSRERRPDTLSPRQGAWVVCLWVCLRVFVGFFGLVGFGCLGVFWGCLVCFLVF